MKTCLFCGSDNFDEQGKCCECNHSSENGALIGEKAESYRRRNLLCPDYMSQFVLIMIPAIAMLFLGLLWLMGHFSRSLLFIELPKLRNCYVFVALCFVSGILLLIYGLVRFVIAKKAHAAYCEVILQDDNAETQANIPMADYYRYQHFATRAHFIWLLIPAILYPFMISFCYYSGNYQYLTILDILKISLPDMSNVGLFKFFMYVLPVLAMICQLADVIFSLVTAIRINIEINAAKALHQTPCEDASEPMEENEAYQSETESERRVGSDIPFAFEDIYNFSFQAPPDASDAFKNLKTLDQIYQSTEEEKTSEISLPELCNRLEACLSQRGVRMEAEQVMSLVSSMAAYRLIFIDAPEECREAVIDAVTDCFGSEPFVTYASDTWQTEADLLVKETADDKEESAYLQGLYNAHHNPTHVGVVAVKGATPALSRIMPTFCKYSRMPGKSCAILVKDAYSYALPKFMFRKCDDGTPSPEVYMNLPRNAWCLLVSSYQESSYIPTDILVTGGALSTVLKCEKQAHQNQVSSVPGAPISFAHFTDVIKAAKETTYLSEDHWKKFDKLEEFLKDRIGFTFGNRLYRKIETYTDTYMACGGDVNHAIDSILVNVLASVLSEGHADVLNGTEGKIGLFELIDKTFGSDNIPKCHELLNSFGMDS